MARAIRLSYDSEKGRVRPAEGIALYVYSNSSVNLLTQQGAVQAEEGWLINRLSSSRVLIIVESGCWVGLLHSAFPLALLHMGRCDNLVSRSDRRACVFHQ